MLLPALLYIFWDIYFTENEIWHFNEKYVTGIKISNLPVEEVLFFFVVPYCCLFIYECVRTYFPLLKNKVGADIFFKFMAIGLWITGIIFLNRHYSSWTFIFSALFITLIYSLPEIFKGFDATSFLVSYVIMLIPFLIINGLLTSIPVVIYNNFENLRVRIYSIPFEDVFYGMLLILMCVVIYEGLKGKR